MARRYIDLVERLSRKQSERDREVVTVRILGKLGRGRALVELPGCSDGPVVATEPTPIACGSSAQAVVNRSTGAVTLLPGPASEPGQATVFPAQVRGTDLAVLEPDDNPGPVFLMRFLRQLSQPAFLTTDTIAGTWDLAAYVLAGDTDPLNNPAAAVGSPIDSINWPGLSPVAEGDNSSPLKVTPLPDGLDSLAPGSLAATTEQDVSTSSPTVGGQSSFKLWDSDSKSFALFETSAVGRRFRQPVLVGGWWWTVEYDVDVPFAPRLLRLKGDLSEPETVISSAPSPGTAALWNLYASATDVYAPIYISSVSRPTQAWKFPMDGGPVSLVSYSQAADFYEFRCRAPSAFPVAGRILHGISGSNILTNLTWTTFDTSTRTEADAGILPPFGPQQSAVAPTPFPGARSEWLLPTTDHPGFFGGGSARLNLWEPGSGKTISLFPGPNPGHILAAWFI